MADKLLVATKSFITNDDGKRVVVHAGRSRYRSSHPIAKAFPGHFTDADSQPAVEDTRSTPSAPARGRPPKDD